MRTGIDHADRVIKVDNHSLSVFRECPKKYQYRIKKGLVSQPSDFYEDAGDPPPSSPLLFGLAIHRALDTLFNEQNLDLACDRFLESFQPVPDDPKRTPGRGCEVLEGYWNRWKENDQMAYSTVQSELKFSFELGQIAHPVSGVMYSIVYCGLIDKVLERKSDGQSLLMDHKTSSWESMYLVNAYAQSQQFLGYLAGAQALGIPAETLIVDILLMKPKNNDFIRSEIRTDSDSRIEWKWGIQQTCTMMLMCDSNDIWPQYGKEPCTSWNHLCEYFQLCDAKPSLRESTESMLYQVKFWDTDRI